MSRFSLKTSIDFAHFGLESWMVFQGTSGVHERIYRFKIKKKDRVIYEFEMDFKKSFCWRSKLSNADDIISA